VLVVGGPQYRAGSHRHFVLVARQLAQAGYPVLRFDVRGMGDSSGPLHTFENCDADIGAAIHTLMAQQPHVQRVVLWGLCDAASAALLYLQQQADVRVQGLCLLNPWVRSGASLAKMHVKHYYWQRLKQPEFWRKLLSGRVAGEALHGLWANLRAAQGAGGAANDTNAGPAAKLSFQQRMAAGWQTHPGPSLLVLSGQDYTAQEFNEYTRADAQWQALLARPGVQTLRLAQADHTFSAPDAGLAVAQASCDWLRRHWPAGAATQPRNANLPAAADDAPLRTMA
jgi:exosortase A-associated hydrolase 1